MPLMVSGSPIENAPTCKVAPLVTEVAPPVPPSALMLPTITVPSLIVVTPVYVFAPDNVSDPAPDFVNVPDPVAIAPEIVLVPAPSMVRLVFVPVNPPDIVNVVPVSTCTSVVANKVIAPDH